MLFIYFSHYYIHSAFKSMLRRHSDSDLRCWGRLTYMSYICFCSDPGPYSGQLVMYLDITAKPQLSQYLLWNTPSWLAELKDTLDQKLRDIKEEWHEEVGASSGFILSELSFRHGELQLSIAVHHPDRTTYVVGFLLSRAFARVMLSLLRGGHRVATRRMESYYRRTLRSGMPPEHFIT